MATETGKMGHFNLYEFLAFKKRVHIFLKNILEYHENRHVTNIYLQTGLISSLKFSYTFLDTFAKLLKATIRLVINVLLFVRMEQLASHWTDFHEDW
jgi:hypothetical protein